MLRLDEKAQTWHKRNSAHIPDMCTVPFEMIYSTLKTRQCRGWVFVNTDVKTRTITRTRVNETLSPFQMEGFTD